AETALAVAEIQPPQAAEALVVAPLPKAPPGGHEAFAPAFQRDRIVGREILYVDLPQVGHVGHRLRDDLHRRQATAGEDVLLDEAAAALLDVVGAVLDQDRLQEH